MWLKLTSFIAFIFIAGNMVFGQACCGEEIVKLEKKLSRKYDSFMRIKSIPKDGEVSSMREVFYLIVKKKKHGLINGNQILIFDRWWEDVELISTTDRKKKFTFFKYTISGKLGLGSIQNGLHLPAEYSDVKVEIINDSNTICLIGERNGQTRIDWLKRGNKTWISKKLDFHIVAMNIYNRASVERYGIYDELLFLNGNNQAKSYELKSGEEAIGGSIGYFGTVKVDGTDSESLLCVDHKTGNYLLMDPDGLGKLSTTFRYNEPIITGHVIEEGLIIAKTANNKYKLPLSKFSQDFQLAAYDNLYHSDQNLFLVQDKSLVIVNRQGSKQISIRQYFEPDLCGNYHPEIHLTEEDVTSFGHLIRSLEGSVFVTHDGQILNESLYLMEVLDKKRCFYLFWEDEYREGIMGVAPPKNKRGLMDSNGTIILPAEYSAIWKKGDYYLTLKGGKISSMILMPTTYYEGEWILYDADFNPISTPVEGAEFRLGGIMDKNGFTIDGKDYSIYDFTKKYFGIGVYEP